MATKKKPSSRKRWFFDILSLANQLHCAKSTNLEVLEQEKIYFSENQVSNLISKRVIVLLDIVKTYNKCVAIDCFREKIADSTGKKNGREEK